MSTINQGAAYLAINAPSEAPFAILATCTMTDSDGDALPWSVFNVDSIAVEFLDQFDNAVVAPPAVSSPAEGQLALSWTADQTAVLGAAEMVRWVMSASIAGVGPSPLLAGPWKAFPFDQPAPSLPVTATTSVQVGDTTLVMAISLGVPSTFDSVIDGGNAGSTYTQWIDGGNAASVYAPSQSIDGGNA